VQWRELQATGDRVCGATLRRRLTEWSTTALLRRVHAVLVRMVRSGPEAAVAAWDVIIDSCSVRAKRGGELTGQNPTDRAKRGTKYHVVVASDGSPLAALPSAANVHDTMLFPALPGIVLIPLMGIAAMAAGALWASLAAAPRAYLGVNETITTLMLNYVALMWLQYLITGPWRDPGNKGFPIAPPIPQGAELPALPGTDLHLGLVLAILLALAYFFLLSRSRWGYEIRVVGESARAAEYAGIDVRRNTMLVLMLSGAVAGLAGMCEVSGLAHRLETSIAGGYGYTAIIIAWLARLNPWGIIAMSIFMSALLIGGDYAQATGISDAISVIIQGVILFFVLGFDLFTQYKIRFHFGKGSERA
jgi:ABC-type uncharacterized transport system permease subunit